MATRVAADCDTSYDNLFSNEISSENRRTIKSATKSLLYNAAIGMDQKILEYCKSPEHDINYEIMSFYCKIFLENDKKYDFLQYAH